MIFFAPRPGSENNSRIAAGNSARSSSQIFQRTGCGQFFDLRRDRFADSGNLGERFFVLQIGQIAATSFNRARGVGVSANLEWIFILQLEQRRDLLERFGDFALSSCLTVNENSLRVDSMRGWMQKFRCRAFISSFADEGEKGHS